MKKRITAIVATLALFIVAGAFALTAIGPLQIPRSDPHGIPATDPLTIPRSDPHSITNGSGSVSGVSAYTIPRSDPHSVSFVFDIAALQIPRSDPH
ncbi:MAG: hypothetical protein FJ151_03800 [Euryarchaeota archaeon]|nr:hypothetical protein [Euryarchaeota archaeon]